VERSWGVMGEGAGRDLIITMGTMALQTTNGSPPENPGHGTRCYNEISTRPLPHDSLRTLHAFLYN